MDAGTVQAWLGHESIATTNSYLRFLGTTVDLAGLERLNFPRGAVGVPLQAVALTTIRTLRENPLQRSTNDSNTSERSLFASVTSTTASDPNSKQAGSEP